MADTAYPMRNRVLSLAICFIIALQACSPDREAEDTGQRVESAISKSEQSLFEGRFKEALDLIAPTRFGKPDYLNETHRIQLLVQELRIKEFQSILLRMENNAVDRLDRLKSFYDPALEIDNPSIRAGYFLSLSSAYRGVGKRDSALLFENKARDLYADEKKLDKIANLDANAISRKHNQYLAEGKTKKILSLIPTYLKQIESSQQLSAYALAYNTRHLAQIYRRQTKEFDKALELFQASLAARQEIGFKTFIPASYSSIADVYLAMENYDKAIEVYSKTRELAVEIGFIRYEYYPLLKTGDIYLASKNLDKARDYYRKARSSAMANNYISAISEAEARLENLN